MAKKNVGECGWRIANVILWYMVLALGLCSREAYEWIRHFARVSRSEAWVNNPWFLSIALSYVVGRFVRNKGVSSGLNAASALYEGIGFGLISFVAFLAFPMNYLRNPLPSGARILYLGYALKFGCWLYLVVCLTRYLIFGNDNAFFRAPAHRPPVLDSTRDES